MIGAINSNIVATTASQYGKTTQTGKVSEAKKTEQKTKSTENSIVSIDGDTLSISAEGSVYVQRSAASGTGQGVQGVTPQVISDTAVSAVSGTTTDVALQAQTSVKSDTDALETYETSEEESDSDNLSEYTDSELRLMMYNGDITRMEYEDEMVSRNGSVASEEEN